MTDPAVLLGPSSPSTLEPAARPRGVPAADPRLPRGSNRAAVLLVLAGFVVFAVMDATSAALGRGVTGQSYPPGQVLFAMMAISLLVFVAGSLGRLQRLRPRRPGMLLARGLAMTANIGLGIYAYGQLPLPVAYAIGFSAPLLTTALAAIFLREQVGWPRLAAIALGFVAVLLVVFTRPTASAGGGIAPMAMLAMLGAATGFACASVMLRVTRASETTEATLVWPYVLMLVLAALSALPPVAATLGLRPWLMPDAGGWALLMLAGLLQAGGTILLTLAFRWGEASTVAPFHYSQLVWAVAAETLVLGGPVPTDLPFVLGLAGVAGAGLYLWKTAPRDPAPAVAPVAAPSAATLSQVAA